MPCGATGVDLVRLFALAAFFLTAMLGGLYATTQAAGPTASAETSGPELDARASGEAPSETLPTTLGTTEVATHEPAPALPSGADVPADALEVEVDSDVIVDAVSGVSIGPFKLSLREEEGTSAEDEQDLEDDVRTASTVAPRARRVTRPAPGPRLDPDPGRHVILTARGMMARGETVRGSCYAYLSEVFDRAGHEGWRTRTVVYQAGPNGPYADLDLIRLGDWLYIVNNPDSTPVGTHSVLFVGWEDRASGYARTISHAGWAAGASPGRESHYDISRTYRIIRPHL
jgi:hypothetical protein